MKEIKIVLIILILAVVSSHFWFKPEATKKTLPGNYAQTQGVDDYDRPEPKTSVEQAAHDHNQGKDSWIKFNYRNPKDIDKNVGQKDPSSTKAVALTGSTVDWKVGELFTQTIKQSAAYSFSNITTTKNITVVITKAKENLEISWPANIKWLNSIITKDREQARLNAKGAVDVYTFFSTDGTEIYGSVVQNFDSKEKTSTASGLIDSTTHNIITGGGGAGSSGTTSYIIVGGGGGGGGGGSVNGHGYAPNQQGHRPDTDLRAIGGTGYNVAPQVYSNAQCVYQGQPIDCARLRVRKQTEAQMEKFKQQNPKLLESQKRE